jgi:two-component system, LytTR family, sensor kinase
MRETAGTRDHLTDWRSIALFWVGYTFLSLNQSYAWNAVAHGNRTWTDPLPWALSTMVAWGLLTPLIVKWSRRHRVERATWRRELPWHLAAIAVVGLVDVVGSHIACIVTHKPFPFWAEYVRKLNIVALYYAIIAGAAHVVEYYRMYRSGQLHASQLESELRQSQLENLKSQLQPHFLFNTLNAVNGLIYEDQKAAGRVINRLGELLRMSLAAGNQQEVPLRYELEFVRAYLDIQQTRLGKRLRVEFDVPEDLYDLMVPTLLLQPLAENAVLHGIAPLMRGGTVRIAGRQAGDSLILTVADTGAGFGNATRRGIGLTNIQLRLRQLYGDDQTFSIEDNNPAGTIVTTTLPVQNTAHLPESELLPQPA